MSGGYWGLSWQPRSAPSRAGKPDCRERTPSPTRFRLRVLRRNAGRSCSWRRSKSLLFEITGAELLAGDGDGAVLAVTEEDRALDWPDGEGTVSAEIGGDLS